MTEHPLLMSGEMIRAYAAGRKKMTRRVIKDSNSLIDGRPWRTGEFNEMDWAGESWVDPGQSPAGNSGQFLRVQHKMEFSTHCVYPRWSVGDRLWFRETHYCIGGSGEVFFRATDDSNKSPPLRWSGPWTPSIHMPRWAARFTPLITAIKVERLKDISIDEIHDEGFDPENSRYWEALFDDGERMHSAGSGIAAERYAYMAHWQKTANETSDWNANPLVWVIEFEPPLVGRKDAK